MASGFDFHIHATVGRRLEDIGVRCEPHWVRQGPEPNASPRYTNPQKRITEYLKNLIKVLYQTVFQRISLKQNGMTKKNWAQSLLGKSQRGVQCQLHHQLLGSHRPCALEGGPTTFVLSWYDFWYILNFIKKKYLWSLSILPQLFGFKMFQAAPFFRRALASRRAWWPPSTPTPPLRRPWMASLPRTSTSSWLY